MRIKFDKTEAESIIIDHVKKMLPETSGKVFLVTERYNGFEVDITAPVLETVLDEPASAPDELEAA